MQLPSDATSGNVRASAGGRATYQAVAIPPMGRNPSTPIAMMHQDGAKLATAIRVLVVEDDAMIGALLGEMLEDMGYDVCGIEATEADSISAAARCRPDLMIVDVNLGQGSGVSAIDAIHTTGPMPHVFVSGDISRIRALRPGSISIQKPYREAELAVVIQQALATRPLS